MPRKPSKSAVRAAVYALRKKYGLSGREPTSLQIQQWTERATKLIETGTKPEEAGYVAARLTFQTWDTEERAPYVEVETLLSMVESLEDG